MSNENMLIKSCEADLHVIIVRSVKKTYALMVTKLYFNSSFFAGMIMKIVKVTLATR